MNLPSRQQFFCGKIWVYNKITIYWYVDSRRTLRGGSCGAGWEGKRLHRVWCSDDSASLTLSHLYSSVLWYNCCLSSADIVAAASVVLLTWACPEFPNGVRVAVESGAPPPPLETAVCLQIRALKFSVAGERCIQIVLDSNFSYTGANVLLCTHTHSLNIGGLNLITSFWVSACVCVCARNSENFRLLIDFSHWRCRVLLMWSTPCLSACSSK